MKLINIHYFALLKDQAGKEQESLEVELNTYRELYLYLANKYQFSLEDKLVQVAVNDEYSSLDSTISHQAKVVFIPPVAGG